MEWKKLYSTMDINEKKMLVRIWERTTIGKKSRHCEEQMKRRGVSEENIARAWKVNTIIEYKKVDNSKRIVVRGLDVVNAYYDMCREGEKISYSTRKEPCNVCLVVDIVTGDLITCYTSPTRMRNAYVNNKKVDKAYSLDKIDDYL